MSVWRVGIPEGSTLVGCRGDANTCPHAQATANDAETPECLLRHTECDNGRAYAELEEEEEPGAFGEFLHDGMREAYD